MTPPAIIPPAAAPSTAAVAEASRHRLALRLTHLVEQVAEGYCVFAVGIVPDEPKSFAAHHAACQAAVAHMDLLIKLARAIAPEASAELTSAGLIEDARRALVNATPDLELTAEQADAMSEMSHVADDPEGGDDLALA